MTIGHFAQLSGLSVKALRHYDETGLLLPAHVDPESGYRWYRPGQAGAGATISVLRSMGMPLEVVRRIVSEPDRTDEHLGQWRAELAAERARQDAAIAAGLILLAAYGRETAVIRRQAAEQRYLGMVLDAEVLDGDPEAGAALVQAGWQDLGQAVAEAGWTASTAWTTIRPKEGRDPGQLVLCLGLDQSSSSGLTASGYEAGTLPARTEVAVVLTPEGIPTADLQPGDAAPPAALVALMQELEREDGTPGTIWQTPLLDAAGAFAGLEISVALERRPPRPGAVGR